MESCNSIFGVVILDSEGNEIFTHNPDLPFVPASLYKLVLITQITTWAEEGHLALTDTVTILPEFFVAKNGEDSYFTYDSVGFPAPIEELLYATGSYSSNVSAMALLSLTLDRPTQFVRPGNWTQAHPLLDRFREAAELYADAEETAAEGDFSRAITFIDSFAGSSTVNVTTPRDMSISSAR